MDNLSLLKLEQSETRKRIEEKQEELHTLEIKIQDLEDKLVKLTNLRSFCLSIPKILHSKIKSSIKLVPAITLLSTFLITSIVACMGYTLETGWQIKEIITALIASSSISFTATTSLAIYSYKSLKKDFGGYSLKQANKDLNETNNEFNILLDKAVTKEKELSQLEVKDCEITKKIGLLTSNSKSINLKSELETPVIEQENQKVKKLCLNTKKH